ncbi:FAD-binding oxidoreductase (plasmid) [Nocardia sp. NBC_01377]|uniref:NAD(P)/FAD-dependent oxidoreductase n=1 Tax=Nocardia sp. NBC_01377 TaxID=2903595 RepID=UPI002F90AC8A
MITVDVAVIGPGIIGACAAWHLAQAGCRVAVLGDQRAGTATSAAVGMLTPTCEWETYEPREWLSFLREAANYYPDFLRRIGLEDTDFRAAAGFRELDFYVLDFHERAPALAGYAELARSLDSDCDYLAPQDPALRRIGIDTALIRGAMHVRGEAVVDPRRLAPLVYDALGRTGRVDVIPTAVVGVDSTSTETIRLRCADDVVLDCDRVLIAAGAWSAEVADLFGLDVPVFPVRGQIIELAGPPGLLQDVLYLPVGACGCLLERAAGQYICGTSEEYRAGTAENTVEVVSTILDRVRRTFPMAGRWSVSDMWAGFRPQTADRLPLIGASRDPRISIATGHFRNGILAGPLTGRVIADHITGTSHFDLALYCPTRALSDPISVAARF